MKLCSTFIFIFFALVDFANACPLVKDLIDFNCNNRLKVTIIGDSIVKGVGDSRYNGDGGYPLRIRQDLNIRVENLGVPGITSSQLLRDLIQNSNQQITHKKLRNADIIIIDVGRNDFWKNATPESVARNIQKLIRQLTPIMKEKGGVPYFVVATLVPTKRSFQQPFVDGINSALLRFKSRRLPTNLYFHKLPNTVISDDMLHPSSKGYRRIAKFTEKYLKGRAQVAMAKQRPDNDFDGIFDLFEDTKFFTDKYNPDTDGDSFTDFEEIFIHKTNPLDPLSFPVL